MQAFELKKSGGFRCRSRSSFLRVFYLLPNNHGTLGSLLMILGWFRNRNADIVMTRFAKGKPQKDWVETILSASQNSSCVENVKSAIFALSSRRRIQDRIVKNGQEKEVSFSSSFFQVNINACKLYKILLLLMGLLNE